MMKVEEILKGIDIISLTGEEKAAISNIDFDSIAEKTNDLGI